MVKGWRQMKNPVTPEQQEIYFKIWVSTYSAMFTARVQAFTVKTNGVPSSEDLDLFARDAEFYAEEAALRGWDA